MTPYKHYFGQRITTDGESAADRAFVSRLQWSAAEAVVADADGIVDGAATTTGAEAVAVVITPVSEDFIAQPPCPRNLTVTVAAATAGNVAAGNIVIAGLDAAGEPISENFAIVADTPATKTGVMAFAEITSITIPVQDGAGVTVDVGYGAALGIGYKLAHNTVLLAYHNNTAESTPPTVAVDKAVLSKNTITLSTTLDGSVVDVYLLV